MAESDHTRFRRLCIMGVKAVQNIGAALQGLQIMRENYGSYLPIMTASLFQTSIIRYSRPFTESNIEGNKVRYPIKRIKKYAGFSDDLHRHLLNIRDTLIAHDDFDQITPRVLIMGMQVAEGCYLPISIGLANKCLAFPSEVSTIDEMKKHCAAAMNAVSQCLQQDAALLRAAYLKAPDPEPSKFSQNYGRAEIGDHPTQMQLPEFMDSEWLNPAEPNFSDIHSGFNYETMKWRQNFFWPR